MHNPDVSIGFFFEYDKQGNTTTVSIVQSFVSDYGQKYYDGIKLKMLERNKENLNQGDPKI